MNPELLNIIQSGDVGALKKFLDACPADFDLTKETDDKGNSPLHLATSCGHIEIFDLLVEEEFRRNGSVNLFTLNALGDDFCGAAIRNRQFAMIDHLRKREFYSLGRAKINKSAEIEYIVTQGDFLLLEFILQRECLNDDPSYNVDLNIKNERGENLLSVLANTNNLKMYDYLVKQYGVKPQTTSSTHDPFHLAIYHGKFEMADHLLSESDEMIFKLPNDHLTHPLTAAVISENIAAVSFLLKKGAYIDLKNAAGHTISEATFYNTLNRANSENRRKILAENFMILSMANILFELAEEAEEKPRELLNTLKILGEGLNARLAKTGDTALHLAIKNNKIDMVSALIKNGADAFMPNHDKITPFDLLKLLYAKQVLARKPLAQGEYLLGLCLLQKIKHIEAQLIKQIKLDNDPQFEEYRLKASSLSLKFKGGSIRDVHLTPMSTKSIDAGDAKNSAETVALENKAHHEQCENQNAMAKSKVRENEINEYLTQMNDLLEKMTEEQATEISFALGQLFSNADSPLYNPFIAYKFLMKIKDKNDSCYCQANSIITDLLLSNKICFTQSGLGAEWEAQAIDNIGDESLEGRTYRIENIIFHALRSKNSNHNAILGRLIAEYTLGANESFTGLKDVKDNDPDSYFALIKEQRELRRQLQKAQDAIERTQQELKAEQDRLNALAMDAKKMQDMIKAQQAIIEEQASIIKMQKTCIEGAKGNAQKSKPLLKRSVSHSDMLLHGFNLAAKSGKSARACEKNPALPNHSPADKMQLSSN